MGLKGYLKTTPRMSLRAEQSNLPPIGLRLLRRYARRNDIHRFEILSYVSSGDIPPRRLRTLNWRGVIPTSDLNVRVK